MADFIDSYWLKALKHALPSLEIARKLEYLEYADRDTIFTENEKIEHYYFLLEGAVICERHRDNGLDRTQQKQFVMEIVGPKPLGEGLYSPAITRSTSSQAEGLVKCCRIGS